MWRTREDNWSLFLDIEGFSASYARDQVEALVRLGRLMEAIHGVGCTTLSEEPHRLFAYQVGDGFAVAPSFGEVSLHRPVALGIVVLRHVLAGGGTARAALSTGGFSDVQGCYPNHVMATRLTDGVVLGMGEGLMTVFSVMGSGLINSHKLGSRTPKGALFVVDATLIDDLPPWVDQIPFEDDVKGVTVDWVRADAESIDQMAAAGCLARLAPAECERRLGQYVRECSASQEWKDNTLRYGKTDRLEDAG
jgi:hypothetical protein